MMLLATPEMFVDDRVPVPPVAVLALAEGLPVGERPAVVVEGSLDPDSSV